MISKILTSACLCSALLIQPAFAEDAIDPETLFNEALKYRQSGDLFSSIEIFETILSNQPSLNRARLELAISYHLTRRYHDAKEQLTKVLNDPETPDEVKLTITAYLAQLSGDIKNYEERSTSSIYISAGAFTDSNINLGPAKEFDNTPINTENSGSGSQLMATYSHRSRSGQAIHIYQNIADFEWQTQATAYSKAHASGKSDFNVGVLSLSTGPALIVENSWRAAFNIKLDKVYFGNKSYANYTGVNPLFTYNVMKDLEVTFENITLAREYSQASDQGLTGTLTMWGFDVAKFYAKQAIGLQAGMKYHDNGAKAEQLHSTGGEFYIGGQIPAWKNARAYLTVSVRDYRYKAADTDNNYTEKRDETEALAVLGVSHDFRSGALKSWTLNTQYTYTDNDSNLGDFTYDRNVLEVNMRRYFF